MIWTAKCSFHVEIRHPRAAQPSQPRSGSALEADQYPKHFSLYCSDHQAQMKAQPQGDLFPSNTPFPHASFFGGDPGRHPITGGISPILTVNFCPSPVSWAGIVSESWKRSSRPGQGKEVEEGNNSTANAELNFVTSWLQTEKRFFALFVSSIIRTTEMDFCKCC